MKAPLGVNRRARAKYKRLTWLDLPPQKSQADQWTMNRLLFLITRPRTLNDALHVRARFTGHRYRTREFQRHPDAA